MDKLFWTVSIIGHCIVGLAIILGIRNLRSKRTLAYRLALALLVASLASDMASLFCIYVLEVTNYPLLHLYTLLEFTLYALLYRSVVQSNTFRKAMVFSIVAFFVFKIADVIWLTGIYLVDAKATLISSTAIITFSMFYFGQLTTQKNIELTRFPMFYINTATLLYFSGNFLLFLYDAFIQEDKDSFYAHWWIHNALLAIKHLLFLVAMILLGRPKASYLRQDELMMHE